jgi:Lysine methyltransferase
MLLKVMELNWGEDASMLGQVDVVLLSDLFYDPEEMLALAKTMTSIWTEQTKGYAASEVRDGVEECLKVLREQGFVIQDVVLTIRPLFRNSAEIGAFAVFEVSHMNCTTLNSGN